MAVEFKDYYATLGVKRDATPEDIKKAFRRLARRHHPDVAKDKVAAEEKFKEINEAHEVLSDPANREKYDRLGAQWRQEGSFPPPPDRGRAGAGQGERGFRTEFHFGGTGFSDFFEHFFGGGHPHGYAREETGFGPAYHTGEDIARRGGDIEGDLLVTLEEAMHGTVRPISLQQMNPQTGEVKTQAFKVRIPPGAVDGRRIRVPGRGGPGRGGAAPGDLFLRVRHAAHPDFHARSADLYRELEVTPWEAVLGAEIVVPTLDGSIKLRLPPGTQNGRQLRVRGHGLPRPRDGERGDFHVVIAIRVPTQLDADERDLWEKLRDTSRFRARDLPVA